MKKKTIIMALSLILVMVLSTGFASAYFTDYEAAKGGAVLKLSGQTKVEEVVKDNNKTITISNTGETDMIVRVQVIGDQNRMTVVPGDGWIKDGDWYYYTRILTPKDTNGARSTSIEAKITGNEGDNFDIIVVQEGSRTLYDGDTLAAPNGWSSDAVSKIKVN